MTTITKPEIVIAGGETPSGNFRLSTDRGPLVGFFSVVGRIRGNVSSVTPVELRVKFQAPVASETEESVKDFLRNKVISYLLAFRDRSDETGSRVIWSDVLVD